MQFECEGTLGAHGSFMQTTADGNGLLAGLAGLLARSTSGKCAVFMQEKVECVGGLHRFT